MSLTRFANDVVPAPVVRSNAPSCATQPKPQPVAFPARKPAPSDAERIAPAHSAPRCRHVKVNGVRCGSPAVSGDKYCYYHQKFHRTVSNDIPCLEDANSVAYAINCVVRGLNTGYMDLKRATALLYAVQNMIPLLKQLHLEPTSDELAATAEVEDLEEKERQERENQRQL